MQMLGMAGAAGGSGNDLRQKRALMEQTNKGSEFDLAGILLGQQGPLGGDPIKPRSLLDGQDQKSFDIAQLFSGLM